MHRAAIATVIVCLLTGVSQAETVRLSPNPDDLGDLHHDWFYAWGIDAGEFSLGDDQEITAARLDFYGLNNLHEQADGDSDLLTVYLLDAEPGLGLSGDWPGVKKGLDLGLGNWPPTDGLEELASFTDDNSYTTPGHWERWWFFKWWVPGEFVNPAEDWGFDFSPHQLASLNGAASDGEWGLGFDADCQYRKNTHSGLVLTLEVEDAATPAPSPTDATVPEPLTALAVTGSLGALGGYIRRRRA
jgi:hypothetical protein